MWDGKQTGQRWKTFRYDNRAHNTITVNNELQLVKGWAPIVAHSASPQNMNAVADVTTLYGTAVSKLSRSISVKSNAYVEILDEIETANDSVTLRWSMVTPAAVKLTGNNTAELSKDGRKLTVKVNGPKQLVMKTWPTNPVTDYDAPNPGTSIIGYEVRLPAKARVAIIVSLLQ